MDIADLNANAPLAPGAPLEEKLARSRALLTALCGLQPPQAVAVAYTGGKDSGVALALWRAALADCAEVKACADVKACAALADCADAKACAALEEAGADVKSPLAACGGPLRALSVDTGLKFPQVTAFRDRLCAEWGVDLTIARPQVELNAYPVAQDKLACCRDLKIAPLGRAMAETATTVLITGLRRDEHPSRAGRPYAELRPATPLCPEHWQVNVILDWTEMDVWAFVTGEALPYCELYHEGYRSLGCMPCTRLAGAQASERAGRDPDKERQLESLKALGYF